MTRFLSLLLIFNGLCCVAFSQNSDIQRIVNLKRSKIDRIDLSGVRKNSRIVASDFAKNQLSSNNKVSSGTVEKVYYFYTEFAQSPTFNQKELDKKRIEELKEQFPEAISNPFVSWELIAQTGCTSAEMGGSYFHGFVLVFRPEPSEADRKEEIARLQRFFDAPEKGFQTPNDDPIAEQLKQKPKKVEDQQAQFPGGDFALFQYFRDSIKGGGEVALNRDDVWVDFDIEIDAEGKLSKPSFNGIYEGYQKEQILELFRLMPKWEPASKFGEPVSSKVNLELRLCYSPIVRGMYNRDGQKPNFKQSDVEAFQESREVLDSDTEDRVQRIEKSSIYTGLNLIVPEEKTALVMDVTSSMSEHLASLNWWIVNSPDSLNIVRYTFFNDGDQTADKKKKIGATGGIYHGTRLHDLTATLMEAMRNGSGGDLEENDIEAAIEAQNQAPNATSVLLIADNFSEVRDVELSTQLNKKVHVLISGDVTAVRACYLDIAKQTGGDLIVNGSRISLRSIQSGQQITIAETRYIFDGKEFKIL